MSRTISPGQYLEIIKSDATPAVRVDEVGFYTLANSITYYVEIGCRSSTYQSAHFQWSAPVVAVITFWGTNDGVNEAALTSTEDGDWLQWNPVTAAGDVPVTGGSVSNLTVTTSAKGGVLVNLSAVAFGRLRARIVVTTGGAMRVADYGKS